MFAASRYANLPRAYGTMLLAYHVAINGADEVIPGCIPGELNTDPAPYATRLQSTNGVRYQWTTTDTLVRRG